jgi:pimeloyl-ACP methyl ester carboxylesterase
VIRRPSALVAILAIAVLLTGCVSQPDQWAAPIPSGTAAPASGAPAGPTGPASWTPCPDVTERQLSNITFDCATIKVPRDWLSPADGKTFDLALVRARARGQYQRIGSLVVNPGGPGGSGVELATALAGFLPSDVLFRFDIVGFDPRGIGKSSPIDCFDDPDLDAYFGYDPDPVSQAEFDGLVNLSKKMAQSCGDKYPDSLHLFSTEQAARDMDAVRVAVGDEKLTYLGYSYGTLLGAVYAQLFPTKIRALVLDGAVDPTQPSLVSTEVQTKGFERAFDNLAAWCRANARRCPIAPDARAAVMSALRTSRTNPATGAGGRKATPGLVLTAVAESLYSETLWEPLADAIDKLRDGDPAGVLELADSYTQRDPNGGYTNFFDALLTVNCTDDDKPITVDQARQLQSDWRAKYPMFGSSSALGLICAQWPGKRDPYPAGKAEGAPPIVVVGTKGDPATPYEQTPALARMLGVGVVLTWEGEGHTAYPQTRCITGAVNSYLIDLKVPADGQSCPAR